METWRPITGHEGYEVSDFGRTRNQSGRILKTYASKANPRPAAVLFKDKKPIKKHIHGLVLAAFIGPRPQGMECCHNDGNCKNNALYNLRWDTHASNLADKITHGTYQYGEKNSSCKLTATQVTNIKTDTRAQPIIAREYSVSQSTVSRIKSGKRRSHG